jgi:hypothetical protein
MTISATSVRFDDDTWVELTDGRALGVPLACFRGCYAQRPPNANRSS